MDKETVERVLGWYGVSRQTILKAALILREDAEGGRAVPLEVGTFDGGRKTVCANTLRDRVMDITKHLPEDKREMGVILNYAHGQFRGRPSRVVAAYWRRVPGEAVVDMAPIAAERLG